MVMYMKCHNVLLIFMWSNNWGSVFCYDLFSYSGCVLKCCFMHRLMHTHAIDCTVMVAWWVTVDYRGVNFHWPHDSIWLQFSCQQFECKTIQVWDLSSLYFPANEKNPSCAQDVCSKNTERVSFYHSQMIWLPLTCLLHK